MLEGSLPRIVVGICLLALFFTLQIHTTTSFYDNITKSVDGLHNNYKNIMDQTSKCNDLTHKLDSYIKQQSSMHQTSVQLSGKVDEVLEVLQKKEGGDATTVNIEREILNKIKNIDEIITSAAITHSPSSNCDTNPYSSSSFDPSTLPKRPRDEKYVYFSVGTEPGITKQKRTFIDCILLASVTNRAVILPYFTQSAGSGVNNVGFWEVVDEVYLRKNLKGLVEFVHQEQVEGLENLLLTSRYKMPFDCPRPMEKLAEAYRNQPERVIDMWELVDCSFAESDASRAVYHGIIKAIRSAPKVRARAEDVIIKVKGYKGDGVPRPFVCVHPRTESDFGVFPNSIRFSMSQIARKMAGTTFEKRGIKIEALYIASGSIDDHSLRAFSEQFPYVLHKSTLLEQNDTLLHSQYEVGTFKALLDFEVCQQAEQFVGHTFSIWSEMIHDLLRLPLPEGEWEKRIYTYVTRGDYLLPYCSSNAYESFGIKCTKEITI